MPLTSESRIRDHARSLLPLAIVYLAIGLAIAMFSPFLALFLTTALRANSLQVTAFLIVAPLSAVLVSTLVGRWSDGRGQRRPALIAAALCGCVAAVAMAVVREYWVLLGVTATLTAMATSLLPQIFAYAREALQGSRRTAMAMSVLRTLFSIAWVAGPPLAAVLLGVGGFTLVYATGAGMLAIAAGVTLSRLHGTKVTAPQVETTTATPPNPTPDAPRRTIWLTVAAFALLQCAGNLGVQAMPLFVSRDLHGSVRDSGLILGWCAALEIPLMLGFGALSTRFPVRRLLLIGAGCSVAYYTLATLSFSGWQLAAGQLLNATSIAATAGLGVTYVQDMLPRHPGRASTLFSNAFPAGAILAGPILGAAQHLGYRAAYGAATVLGAIGLVVLVISRRAEDPARFGSPDSALP